MRFSKIALALGLAAATVTAASAATFTADYRHDYRSDYGQHFDRIALIGALDNGISFYVDSSFKSGSDNPPSSDYSNGQWGDFVTNATEMNIQWTYKVPNTGFSIAPGLVTESTNTGTAYKPYVRFQYNTDFGLWFAIRPRFDYARNDSRNCNGSTNADARTGRLDAWVGYGNGPFGINYNFTYMKSLDDYTRHLYNGEEYNYEQNLAMNYRLGKWNPYVEFGDIAAVGTSEKSGRQLRFRVGVQYTF